MKKPQLSLGLFRIQSEISNLPGSLNLSCALFVYTAFVI